MSTQEKWTNEQQLKWQHQCILEDLEDLKQQNGDWRTPRLNGVTLSGRSKQLHYDVKLLRW